MFIGDRRLDLRDAQQRTLAFLTSQLTYIEPTVYKIQYPDLPYAELFPVDTSAPDWIRTVTYFSQDRTGRAEWYHGRAQDVPNADVTREKFVTPVQMAAIGYSYTLEELGTAMLEGRRLDTDRADAARRASQEMVNRVAFLGDTVVNFSGIANQPSVTATTAPADGTGSSTLASTKTPQQIIRDLMGPITGIYTGSLTVEMADTVLMPYALWNYLGTVLMGAGGEGKTVLQWFRENNIYTQTTGRQLTIRGVIGLETAGAGSTNRIVYYRRDPGVLKMHMPMPYRFLPVWQTGPMEFSVPGIFRMGGLDVKRTGAMRYLDGL